MPKPPKSQAKSFEQQIASALRPAESFSLNSLTGNTGNNPKHAKPDFKTGNAKSSQSKPPTSAPRRTSG